MSRPKKGEGEAQHYCELNDIPRASVKQIKDQIKLSMDTQQHRGVPCIVGEAGIGKSQIVAQLAKASGAKVYDIRTAHYGLVGAGIPSTKNAPEGFFDVVVPSVFPKPGEKSIMLFEEINQGLPHAISMFFSLIEDRRMFNYVLPEDTTVIALMNPATAQYAVTAVEKNAALKRRLKWIFAIANFRDWLEHAKTPAFHDSDSVAFQGEPKPCHPQVLSYVQIFNSNLYDTKARDQGKVYACPATWQTVSLDMYMMEKGGYDVTSPFALNRISASIGNTMGIHYLEFVKDHSTAVRADDVIEDYTKRAKKAVISLLESSQHEKINELNVNVLRYMFGVQPKAKKAAHNLVEYLLDLPNEMRSSVLNQLRTVSDENDANDYLFDIVRNLQRHKNWVDVHTQLDETQTLVEKALEEV